MRSFPVTYNCILSCERTYYFLYLLEFWATVSCLMNLLFCQVHEPVSSYQEPISSMTESCFLLKELIPSVLRTYSLCIRNLYSLYLSPLYYVISNRMLYTLLKERVTSVEETCFLCLKNL
jgi:hypothetical protein